VLAAIAAGNTTNGGIANYVGRKSAEIAHPLRVLEDCGLVERHPDLFEAKRIRYSISEPLIIFYGNIMRPRWAALESRGGSQVWESARHTFDAQVLGPHFESLCRSYVRDHDTDLFGEFTDQVGSAVVNDPAVRAQIEVDVAATAAESANEHRRVRALGEAKWGEVIGTAHVDRLTRARELLAQKKFDTTETQILLFSAAGFTDELQAMTDRDPRLRLIRLTDLCA